MASKMSTYMFLFTMATTVTAVDIQIPSGRLRGKVTEIEGKKLMYFLNIPFAKPPIGDLRFQEPVPYRAWKGIRAAMEPGPPCPQTIEGYNVPESVKQGRKELPTIAEDCLHLDVYVPGETLPERPIPVMVWIHGGGFLIGDASSYDASYIAAIGEVIVVVIQYRLGVFGFLSSADNVLPGNNGLKDQILAFKWVQENIPSFGGDRTKVTIFGESTGAYSIASHLLNARNKGLFNKAIMQSGSSAGNVCLCSNPRRGLLIYGKAAGCLENNITSDNMSVSELVDCLRGLSIDVMLKLQTEVSMQIMSKSMFDCFAAPVVDGDLIRQHPYELMQDSSSEEFKFFQSVDIIAGCNSFESAFMGSMVSGIETAMNYTPVINGTSDEVTELMIKSATPGLFDQSDDVTTIMMKRVQNANKTKQGIDMFQYLSDIMFTIPMKRLLKAHINKKSSTYEYLFAYETTFDIFAKRVDWLKGTGADHATDLLLLFGPKGIAGVFDLEAKELQSLRHQMIKYWSNFAKTGDPNEDGLVYWPQYEKCQGTFLQLDVKPSTRHAMFDDRVIFLMEVLPTKLSNFKDEL